uniref:hypothetical protein n=1 Tax=Pseudomonas sp. TaxID=306 RepID=UPI0010B7D1E2|nr:hypothetical protein [Pseudomonas sp.]QBM91812.1 hypothetical protein pA54BH1_p03 [Pseudomonas sp.]
MIDTLRGALALGIILGKQESTEDLEALANEVAAGTDTQDIQDRLKKLGTGLEGAEIISVAVKEAVYDRASDGHMRNFQRLRELAKELKGRA